MEECRYYKNKSKEQVQCLACNHYCVIPKNKVGRCGIRQNQAGKLYLLSYGKAIATQIDPVEKKPLYHFLPGTFTYSFGTLGCNFRCLNCQNFEISQIYGVKRKVEQYPTLDWGYQLTPAQIIKEAKKYKCPSISFTYNEPTIFAEYALDTMRLAKKAGLKTIWVSNGFMSKELRKDLAPYLDAINIDVKSFSEAFYKKVCSASLQPVLDNCQYFKKQGVWLEITTLVIPGLSDDTATFKKIARFIKEELGQEVPWHLSAFSGAISWKLTDTPATPPATLETAYQLGKEAGLQYVYAGGAGIDISPDTQCSNCQENIIKRKRFKTVNHLLKNRCPHCQKSLPGVFQEKSTRLKSSRKLK